METNSFLILALLIHILIIWYDHFTYQPTWGHIIWSTPQNSPGCRINLFGGDVHPAVDTMQTTHFEKHHPFYPPTKKKTWLRDVEGMNA